MADEGQIPQRLAGVRLTAEQIALEGGAVAIRQGQRLGARHRDAGLAAASLGAGLALWHRGGGQRPPSAVAQAFWSAEFERPEGGQKLQARELAGKPLLLNFWATWCAPCVKEMPTLDALQVKLGGANFQVLAVSQDREGLKVDLPFVEKNGWKSIGLYVEPKARFAKDAALRGLPTTIILDQSGQEIGRLEGTIDWMAPKVTDALSRLIAKSPA